MRPDSLIDFGAIQVLYLLTYLLIFRWYTGIPDHVTLGLEIGRVMVMVTVDVPGHTWRDYVKIK